MAHAATSNLGSELRQIQKLANLMAHAMQRGVPNSQGGGAPQALTDGKHTISINQRRQITQTCAR